MDELRHTILIVDDNKSIVDTAIEVLKPLNSELNFVLSGEEVFSFIKKNKPDLILLDILMPGIDGYEVCQRIKADPLYNDIVIIFLTGEKSTDSLVKGFEYGAVDYIKKPFSGRELFVRVKTQLENIVSKSYIKHELSKLMQEREILQSIAVQQSKFATLAETYASISHQWKQPLSNITTTTSVSKIKEYQKDHPDQDLLKRLNSIDSQINFMVKTIHSFTNFFKPDKKPKEFSLLHSLNALENLMGDYFKKNLIEVTIESENDLNLFGQQNMLQQVILNIITNAKDEILKTKAKDRSITINFYQKDQETIITISNNAGCIKEKHLSKIFDQFFTTKANDGMGIGLYMSKKIIEETFKGKISAENSKHGVIFKIVLPIVGVTYQESKTAS